LKGIYGTSLAISCVVAIAKLACYTRCAKAVHRALEASTTHAVALVVCPRQVRVTGVKYKTNMPISSILSYITELTWHISGNEKVSCWAVAAEAIRK
jgi:hypothetical protein